MHGPRLAPLALAHAELQNFCSASTRHWQGGCMHLIKVSVDINNSCVENVDFGHGHRNHTEFFGLASGFGTPLADAIPERGIPQF